MRIRIARIFALLLPLVALSAQSRFLESDQRKMNRLLRDGSPDLQSPLVLENALVFFYYGQAREVLLAGEFNSWALNLPMKQEKSNLWVAAWTNRLPAGEYKYRFRVDGFWIPDPTNPLSTFDASREELSLFTLDAPFIADKKYPLWLSNDVYRFRYINTNTRAAAVAGSFNSWNPFSHQMAYLGAGLFEIDITLDPKKIHLYSIVADGIWILDEGNRQQYRSPQGRPVNGFYADREASRP